MEKADKEMPVRRVRGKVFETDWKVTKCECGEEVQQPEKGYLGTFFSKEGQIQQECYVGFCTCGNIFIAQRPLKIEKVEVDI